MKTSSKTIVILMPLALLGGPIAADMEPQPQIAFTQGLQGTFAADWQGVAGRTYFIQWSQDLVSWHYAPFIDFGDGMHSRGIESSTPQLFIRLHHGDFPEITSLDQAMNADLDSDGLSNIFEVTYGYDPFDPASTMDGDDNALDPDGDGMTNATEQTSACDPMRKDNPKVKLQVVAY